VLPYTALIPMKKILTELSVKRMRPPASGSVDVFDQSYPALHLRISCHGAKSWAARIERERCPRMVRPGDNRDPTA
jgi:hypothetical protein